MHTHEQLVGMNQSERLNILAGLRNDREVIITESDRTKESLAREIISLEGMRKAADIASAQAGWNADRPGIVQKFRDVSSQTTFKSGFNTAKKWILRAILLLLLLNATAYLSGHVNNAKWHDNDYEQFVESVDVWFAIEHDLSPDSYNPPAREIAVQPVATSTAVLSATEPAQAESTSTAIPDEEEETPIAKKSAACKSTDSYNLDGLTSLKKNEDVWLRVQYWVNDGSGDEFETYLEPSTDAWTVDTQGGGGMVWVFPANCSEEQIRQDASLSSNRRGNSGFVQWDKTGVFSH